MNEKEERAKLKMEILEKIPEKFGHLRKIISTRYFSEEELKKLIITAERMRLTEQSEMRMARALRDAKEPGLNIPPGKHDMPK